ncbi:MAG: sulfotransferase [Phycisphaerales bacterium]|nr:sulfotransferase [Phycisphaerales bacterium]
MADVNPHEQYDAARAHYEAGRLDDAGRALAALLAEHPTHDQAINLLGVISLRTGRGELAVALFQRAVSVNADAPEYLMNLGNAQTSLGRYDAAVASMKRAIDLHPRWTEAYLSLAEALRLMGKTDVAIAVCEQAIRFEPESAQAHALHGQLHLSEDRLDEAESAYRAADHLAPHSNDIIAGLALIHERRGESEAGFALVESIVHSGKSNVSVELVYGRIARQLGKGDEAVAVLEQRLGDADLPVASQRQIHYALVKLCDKVGRYEQAFRHAEQAYSDSAESEQAAKAASQLADALREVFAPERFEVLPVATVETRRPIFIVGMPRSGTSLVEQILSCHPAIEAGGELQHIPRMVRSLSDRFGLIHPYPLCVPDLSGDQMNELAREYLKHLDDISSDAPHVTDKLPGNVHHLGLILRLFPDARVIHCVRHPLDTCLSCLFEDFGERLLHTRSLQALGEHYVLYDRLVRHWKHVLPIPIFDVVYEDMVEQQERTSRAMIEFLDLPWTDACLRFHESDRVVATASYDQVRKPIYKSSSGRHRHYQRQLAPLAEALGGVLEGW